jgi:hypothetical protein
VAAPDLKVVEEGKEHHASIFSPRLADVRLHLRDAQGQTVTSSGSSGSGDGKTMAHEYELSGRPAKITVRAAAKIEKREIPFRFADVPLPR